jgi:RimJ/RimL family protein N-acetyltransferase
MLARMQLELSRDPARIVALLTRVLAADPVRNTVLSSVITGLQAPDADGWCAHPTGRTAVLAARSQARTPVVVAGGWDDVSVLADALVALPPSLAALSGPVPLVRRLATALAERGLPSTAWVDERLFRLDELIPPARVAGAPRLATHDDLNVLVEWAAAFTLEAFGRLPPAFDAAAIVGRALDTSRIWLWHEPGGAPVSMAWRRAVAFGVSRVGPVYTPVHLRGHAYGSAATAAATRDVLDEGAIPVLFTDLANPTSNKVYQRLGYHPVEDHAYVEYG